MVMEVANGYVWAVNKKVLVKEEFKHRGGV